LHKSSIQQMARLVENHLPEGGGKVLDVGSLGVNGIYRALFDSLDTWQYSGLDVEAGPNVDIVAHNPYDWDIEPGTFDLIISGQAFEHIEFFWITFIEMARVLKPGGHVFLIAPSRGGQHRYPVDCWRYYPDGYAALAKWGGMELIDVNNPWEPDPEIDSKTFYDWGDTVGVFRKIDGAIDPKIEAFKAGLQSYLSGALEITAKTDYPVIPPTDLGRRKPRIFSRKRLKKLFTSGGS